jgi:hypothetical protein
VAEVTKDPMSRREEFIDNIKVGDLIAFKLLTDTEKLISGKVKIVNHRKGTQDYDVETKNGKTYNIPKQNVAWVNKDNRWPKGVLEAFRKRLDDEPILGSSEEAFSDGAGSGDLK